VHKGTSELYANVLTKPLQGNQFVYERGCLTRWPATEEKESKPEERAVGQGCSHSGIFSLRRPSVCALRFSYDIDDYMVVITYIVVITVL
jgi:hypothetical protein